MSEGWTLHFKEAHLLAVLILNLNSLCSCLEIGLTEYFLAVHFAERVDWYTTVCLQDKVELVQFDERVECYTTSVCRIKFLVYY